MMVRTRWREREMERSDEGKRIVPSSGVVEKSRSSNCWYYYDDC
jgi:hypothetical protein